MKTTQLKSVVAVALLAAVFCAGTVKAENIIRQTMLKSGLTYDVVTNDDTGNGVSYLPMEKGGAAYSLFARGSAWDTNLYFLDQKVVGHYLPEATIEVKTGDIINESFRPNVPARTRADKPFTLAISVSGLVSDNAAPAASKKAIYTHMGQNYDYTYTPNGNVEYSIYSAEIGNTSPNYTPVYTSLSPAPDTKAMGVETFTIASKTDATVPKSSILAEEMLLVWPVSEAGIAGIKDGMVVRDNLPPIMAYYSDLYPWSFTYMQIYPGPESLGTVGAVFQSSVRAHDSIVPQNETVLIEHWQSMIPDDGIYTIEVLMITPFNSFQPERLAHVTFEIDQHVTFRGQSITSEK